MSRIGNLPISVPKGVDVTVAASQISIKGPLGTLSQPLGGNVEVQRDGDSIVFKAKDDSIQSNAMTGTLRALVANMVQGVTKGFERKLTLVGVGYRAQAQGDKLNLTLGFSHPVVHQMPKGIKVETPQQTEIVIKGIDKQVVGQVAADVRGYRPPEPYKGKGVRYADERVVLKETKKK
ncbi:MAG TPA: 50S ribosomal protein L6 [Burkholderiales bacterium]|jgi:large subunit ribosomal protein L6|nr:50S ribosomal protein L6 [Burkholderiales bacterium]